MTFAGQMISALEIRTELERDSSKANVDKLVSKMAKQNFEFDAFFLELKNADKSIQWRMTWTLNHYLERYPHIGPKKQRMLWEQLEETRHEGMLRDYWRMFNHLTIDEDLEGLVYDRALKVFPSQSYPTAVRVYALQTAYNIALGYPELMMEVREMMLELKEYETSGMWARLKNLLKSSEKVVGQG